MASVQPTIVSVPNAEDVYIGGVQLVIANKVYALPSVKVPDNFELVVIAQIGNPGNILISRQSRPSVFNSIVLLAGQSFRWRVKNANIFNVLGTAANCIVILTCEQKGA